MGQTKLSLDEVGLLKAFEELGRMQTNGTEIVLCLFVHLAFDIELGFDGRGQIPIGYSEHHTGLFPTR